MRPRAPWPARSVPSSALPWARSPAAWPARRIAEQIDPTVEDAYWRDNYASRPYVDPGASYDDFGPAYSYGVNSYSTYAGRDWDDVEPELSSRWNVMRGSSSLDWDRAKHATRDAWNRVSDAVERAVPGDSDRDGK